MGKRSDFKRRERDFYPTPYDATLPLIPHLGNGQIRFEEPCCGEGNLIQHLYTATQGRCRCVMATDIENRMGNDKVDALDINYCRGDVFITNPPWPLPAKRGDPTLEIALHLCNVAPTWLLLPADIIHNKYWSYLEPVCEKIVSVGRVKWIPDSLGPGKDNCIWALFDAHASFQPTKFYGQGSCYA